MLKEEIYSLVKSHNGCDWGLSQIKQSNEVSDLIGLLKSPKGLEFVMTNDFLPLELLKKYKKELESENIFFEGSYTLKNPRFALILDGKVSVEINNFEASKIYAKDGILMLRALDNCFVSLDVKNCQVFKEIHGNARVKQF
ncbi:Uncharacterised protein [Sphingobacterium multivorum]|uniref:hypothetical protein n=1 Tax=Sphingobacterium multivorum TaxID=28454 RepID=UPI000E050684|nr:hypothetical protein [Sphingobacterium multivorum]QQT43348.1 hypothetical protein I6J00_16510 [Sphingobacterium multivorum]SUI98494.1 Uncharacterised protein [Sphingobacterium multivorum]